MRSLAVSGFSYNLPCCWEGGWVTIGEQIDTNWIRIALYELACEQQTYFRREATTENTSAVRRLYMNATNDIVH